MSFSYGEGKTPAERDRRRKLLIVNMTGAVLSDQPNEVQSFQPAYVEVNAVQLDYLVKRGWKVLQEYQS
jgi:hypothetical protein